jgi:uncharacterized phage-like protein YoqJ
MSKKTVKVAEMVDFANELLANENFSVDFKEGVIEMIQKVYSKSDSYNGFMFINSDKAILNYDKETGEATATQGYVSRRYFHPRKYSKKY